jgi:hypothetical protein
LSRRTVTFLPLIEVCLSAPMTTSATSLATSTSENRSLISMPKICWPLMPDSLVIAPTRSPGRMPA